MSTKLSKRQRRLADKANTNQQKFNLELKDTSPITDNQALSFEYFKAGYHLSMLGCAGTGKTYIGMYLALREIFNNKSGPRKLVIVRTAQPSKQIGFLPGDEKQKIAVYEPAYKAICNELFGRGDAYEVLKAKEVIEFTGTSFLRGTTIDDAVVLIDEVQNMCYQEIRTILTRLGERSRVVICGDTKQDDLTSERYHENSGIHDMIRVFEELKAVKQIIFEEDDIVRGDFVRDFIIAENRAGV